MFVGDTTIVPIRITGGTAPYALSIDWGDGITELKTVLDSEYHNYTHTYKTSGIIGISLKTTDANGATSFLHTVVQVNGVSAHSANSTPLHNFASGLTSIWTEAPVPLYVAAVALVLGFWVGDLFQRIFAKDAKGSKNKKSTTPQRRRHA